MAHSKGDDDRDPAEVRSYWDRDPLDRLRPRRARGRRAGSRPRSKAGSTTAVAVAEASPYADRRRAPSGRSPPARRRWSPTRIEAPDRVVAAIHDALRRNMARDDRIVLIGEDIEGPYGGAFKVTKDLSLEFPGRVRNTPISRVGHRRPGQRPGPQRDGPGLRDHVRRLPRPGRRPDHQPRRRSSSTCTTTRSTSAWSSGPRWAASAGYGPTHSQSLEKHFLGLPGTRMLALHHRHDPGAIYDALFATIDRPTIVIENKLLYGLRTGDAGPRGVRPGAVRRAVPDDPDPPRGARPT